MATDLSTYTATQLQGLLFDEMEGRGMTTYKLWTEHDISKAQAYRSQKRTGEQPDHVSAVLDALKVLGYDVAECYRIEATPEKT